MLTNRFTGQFRDFSSLTVGCQAEFGNGRIHTHVSREKKDAKKSTTVGQINQLFVHIYESGKGAIFSSRFFSRYQ